MRRNDLNVHVFQNRIPRCSQNPIDDFFLTLTVREKSENSMGVQGFSLKKPKPCMQNLSKDRKQQPVVILQ